MEQVKVWLEGNGLKLSKQHLGVDPKADIIILTTCGVTQLHEDFTFEALNKIKAGKKSSAIIILGGCVPEINPKRTSIDFGGPIFSPKSYYKLDEILQLPKKLNDFSRPNTPSMNPWYRTDVGNVIEFSQSLRDHALDIKYIFRRLSSAIHNRQELQNLFRIQIHEGCSMGCTYCAIQKAIGPLRNSKPIEVIENEINNGLDQGYSIIRLIGDSSGSYGIDIGTNLGELLKCILRIKRKFFLELTDINPIFLPIIYEPVIELSLQKKLSKLYIPLQSGSDRILSLMNRKCDMNITKKMLLKVRENASSQFRIGTSVILGFPSETMMEMRDTINICNDVGFNWIWCHGFSPRPGTAAYSMSGQLSEADVLERIKIFKGSISRKKSVIVDFESLEI
jgi:threonylcarbamoyladenosine tRNA methylthiotransferase MtaB